jgi:hypothetical protein
MKQFSYNQENLELMSLDLDLVTTDIHIWNDFYGQSNVIKNKIFFKPKTLYSTLEHGVGFDDIIWHIDKNSVFKSSLIFSEFRKNVYKRQTKNYIFNIGSIINYIELNKVYNQKDSIYFLTHSTHEIDVNVNLKQIIDELKKLPLDIRPEFVCIYWKDIQRGKHIIFLENGFKVISAGHMYDNLFLYRLKEIFMNFKVLITNELGSHVFHANTCGLDIIVPHNLTACYFNDKYALSNHFDNKNEEIEFQNSIKSTSIVNDFFIEIFNEQDFFNKELQKILLNNFCSSKRLSNFDLSLIQIFTWLVHIIKPSKGWIKHVFDFLYVRLDKRIS